MREARAAEAAQDVRVAPLALRAARQELAADEVAGPLELAERGRGVDPVTVGGLLRW